MEEYPNISQDRADSIQFWEERCECRDQRNGDFLRCRCGVAKRAGLVCGVCESELVVRYTKETNAPFWACSYFSRTGCEFTRRIIKRVPSVQDPATPTKVARTPSSKHGTKRTKLISPNSPQQPDTDSETRTTSCKPVCLFPAEKTLHDTFIGADWAADLIACGVPERVYYSRSEQDEGASQHPKLYYEENRNTNEFSFCYWYKEQSGKFPGTVGRKSKPVVLEIFAGAGGMSLGLSRAGLDVKYAVEIDDAAADTLRSNHKSMVVFQQNVIDFLDETKPKSPCYPEKVDHVQAAPPCQGFSQAKQSCHLTLRDKQNNDLMLQFPKAVKLHRPTTASMETVKGILSSAAKKRYLQEVVAELLKMGYQVRVVLLNAEDYGVPQERNRVFLFAAQKGHPLPQVPMPLNTRLTVDKALCDLEAIEPVERGIPVLVNGNIVYDNSIDEQFVHCGNMDYLQRGRTANTVRRRNGIAHYARNGLVTMRERARLQSFPDSYHFCGRPEQQSDQIGNAVPVKLAEAVGRSIMETFR